MPVPGTCTLLAPAHERQRRQLHVGCPGVAATIPSRLLFIYFLFFKLVLAAIILLINPELPPCDLSMHPLPSEGVAKLQPQGSPGSCGVRGTASITLSCCLHGQRLHRRLRSSSMGMEKKSSFGTDVTWQGSAKPAAAGIKALLAHEEAIWLLYSRLGPHFGLLQLCREVRCGRRAARLGRMQDAEETGACLCRRCCSPLSFLLGDRGKPTPVLCSPFGGGTC